MITFNHFKKLWSRNPTKLGLKQSYGIKARGPNQQGQLHKRLGQWHTFTVSLFQGSHRWDEAHQRNNQKLEFHFWSFWTVFFNAEAKGLFVDLKWSFKGFFFSLETQAEVEWLKELEVSKSKSFLTSGRFPRCHEMKQHEYNTSLYSFQVPLLGLEEPPYGY